MAQQVKARDGLPDDLSLLPVSPPLVEAEQF